MINPIAGLSHTNIYTPPSSKLFSSLMLCVSIGEVVGRSPVADCNREPYLDNATIAHTEQTDGSDGSNFIILGVAILSVAALFPCAIFYCWYCRNAFLPPSRSGTVAGSALEEHSLSSSIEGP